MYWSWDGNMPNTYSIPVWACYTCLRGMEGVWWRCAEHVQHACLGMLYMFRGSGGVGKALNTSGCMVASKGWRG